MNNKQRASVPEFLRDALFQLQNALEPGEKGHPLTDVFCFLFPTEVASLLCRHPPITTAISPQSPRVISAVTFPRSTLLSSTPTL